MKTVRGARFVVAFVAAALLSTFLGAVPAGAAPAAPTITGSPSSVIGGRTAAFTFAAVDADTYQCRTYTTGSTPGSYFGCAGGSAGSHETAALADGNWTFEVRGVQAGTPGPSTTFPFTVTSAPVVQWVTKPSGTYGSRDLTATFTAPGATSFQCRLTVVGNTPGSFFGCAGSSGQQGMWQSNTLADGSYTLEVRGVYGGGNGPIATADFSVAASPAPTWITRPEGTFAARQVTATFTAAGADTFQCRLYATGSTPGSFFGCSGSSGDQGMWQSNTLADGAYTLEVRAQFSGAAGAVASTQFTVAASPAPTWITRPEGTFAARQVTATFTAAGADGFQCRLTRAGDAAGSFFGCSGSSGDQGMWQSNTLADGAYTLEVRAQFSGAAGAVASTQFTVAASPAPTWVVRPQGTVTADTVTATFLAAGADSFQCRSYATGGTPGSFFGCSGSSGQQGMWQSNQLAPGNWTLEVRGVFAGTPGPATSTTFTTQAPTGTSTTVSLTTGPAQGATIPTSWVAYSWNAPAGTCYRVELDGADNDLSDVVCSSFEAEPRFNVADGPHVLRIQAQNSGGTYGPVLVRNFTVDSSPATAVALTTGPAQGVTIPTSWVAYSWTSTAGTCYRVELDGTDDDLSDVVCSSYEAEPRFNVADGPHVLRIQAQSSGGTYGPVLVRNFSVDSSSLSTVALTTGPAEGSVVPTSWIAYSWASAAGTCYRVELDGDDDDLTNVVCSSFEAEPRFNVADGPHVLRIQALSRGGTYGPVLVRNFTVDSSSLSTVALTTGPAEGSVVPTSWIAYSWASAAGTCYRVELDGADADLSNVVCSSFEAEPRFNVADGPHVLRIQARSRGGTDGPVLERRFVVRAGPIVNVWSQPRVTLPTGTAAFSWSAPGATCYRVEVDGADADLSNVVCSSFEASPYFGLGDGPHVLRIQAQNTGGTYGPVSQTAFNVESRAPDTTITARPPAQWNSPNATFSFTADEPATFTCSVDGAPAVACTSPFLVPGLADGPHQISIRATDLVGKPDPTPATATWDVDTVAPTIIDLTGPTGVTADPDADLTFQADEPSTFECRLNAGAWEPCSSPLTYPGLADGPYTFDVRARDAAGNQSAVRSKSWTVLTDPPETVITSGPPVLTNQTSATITFTSPDVGATFECRLDAGSFSSCSSPWTVGGLTQGAHTAEVRAVLAGVLVDPTPASVAWTVDSVAPTATITSGPTGTVGIGASIFAFTASEPATFTCSLDGAPYVACSSPTGFGALPDGPHTFSVRATDAAGNTGAPATRSWSVDGVAPVVTITGGPSDPTSSRNASVTFTVDDPSASVECRLDTGPWAPCTSPYAASSLADGSHTVSVRATDPAGNVSGTAQRTWTVDTVAPVVTITGGTSGTVNVTTASVTFTVNDPTATTECRLDAGPWSPCTSPRSFTGVGAGPHTMGVRATDPAGNVGPVATRSFTVDLTAPTVTITGGPTATVATGDASVTFTVDDPTATTECRLDSGPWAACTSPFTASGLANGAHLVEVRATDPAGNVGPVAQRSWSVLTVEPETTIVSGPSGLVNTSGAVFGFSSNDPSATFECQLDGASTWTPCGPTLTLTSLAQGAHRLDVRARVGALVDPSPARRDWTVDTVAPVVTITSAPPAFANAADSVLRFTVDDPTATAECRVDGGAWAPCASPFAPSLADGTHTVDVRATDTAGNVSAVRTATWTLDGTAPVVDITTVPPTTLTTRSIRFDFTVDDPTATVECSVDQGGWIPCTSPQLLTGLTDGLHGFSVRARDAAGNEGGEGKVFFVDATPPTITFTSGPPAVTTSRDATLTFTVDDPGATLECRTDGGPWAPCPTPTGTVTLTGLADGPHAVEVRGTDEHGNAAAPVSRGWIVDNTAPTVTITSGPAGSISVSSATFAFAADEPATFQCRLDGGPWTACASPRTYTGLAVGAHTFDVRAFDQVGLVSELASRAFSVDIAGSPSIGVTLALRTTSGLPVTTAGLGDDVVLRATLTNTGPVASTGTVLEVPLGGGLRLAAAPPAGCTSAAASGPVTCQGPNISSIAAGATAVVDLRVEAVPTVCTVWGDSGANTALNGTAGNDVICGGGGGDTILGRGGSDTVWGYGPRGGTFATPATVRYGPGGLEATAAPVAVTVAGADGADTVTTADGPDVVNGEEGADRLVSGGGSDTILAGDGDDTVETGSGGDTAQGGNGADTISGGNGADNLSGGAGNDRILGFAEADLVDGGDGADSIEAGTGANVVTGGTGNDTVQNSTGTVSGQAGADTILGTDGADVIDGGTEADWIDARGGDDRVLGGDGNDTVYAGEGNDDVNGGAGGDRLEGAGGADVLSGAGGADVVYGQLGNDQLLGDADADQLDGGDNADSVYGGTGDDTVRGGAGNDTVVNGQDGNDVVHGDDGSDPLLVGGDGADRVYGGAGADTLYGAGGGSPSTDGGDLLDGGTESDRLFGGAGDDDVRGGPGNDRVDGEDGADRLLGEDGDDDLNGDAGADTMNGGAGRDVMIGFSGDDVMQGGDGADYLDGSAGDDNLNGGYGRDTLRGNAGDDRVDGGPAAGPAWLLPNDHWNRLYGDADDNGTPPSGGTYRGDLCSFGPGSGADNTDYRDATCEAPSIGRGWLNGSRSRLDRGP